jgi:hypothetical protein
MFMNLEITIVYIEKLINTSTGHPVTCCEWCRRGVDVYLYPYRTSVLDEGGWSLCFLEGETVPIVEKAGWAPGPVGMGVVKRKSLAPTDVCT